jgi:hypothetical protein
MDFLTPVVIMELEETEPPPEKFEERVDLAHP